MLNAVLTQKSTMTRITVKSLVAVAAVAMAVASPQLVHVALGAPGGVQWLPMYWPILLGGCLLGFSWGGAVGVLAPLASFLLTTLVGEAMPAAERLPYMMAELLVMAAVCGAFSARIAADKRLAFPAVWLAQLAGRAVFLALAAIPGGLSLPMVWAQVQNGVGGLLLQAVAVPVLVLCLHAAMKKER